MSWRRRATVADGLCPDIERRRRRSAERVEFAQSDQVTDVRWRANEVLSDGRGVSLARIHIVSWVSNLIISTDRADRPVVERLPAAASPC